MTAKLVIGDSLGGYKIIKDLGMQLPRPDSKKKRHYVIAKCPSCAGDWKVQTRTLKTRNAATCRDCKSRRHATHGMSKTRIYAIWRGMKYRCDNPNLNTYKNYGGRGISYCAEWKAFSAFMKWANNNGYADDLEIDRIDPDGNYYPGNCRFVDRETNAINTRLLMSRNKSGFRGVCRDSRTNNWRSTIMANGKYISLGVFESAKEAAVVRDNYVIDNNLEHPLNF